jgi:DNA-binding XRE family transcriptional regulator
MDKKEFSVVRRGLGKTQKQLAQLLGDSPKAIQSFEQGWRNIPVHAERQLLFLLALKQSHGKKGRPCWVVRKCPEKIKQDCPAWEFRAGNLCWFISGTICQGKVQESWKKKMNICRRCEVFRTLLPPV